MKIEIKLKSEYEWEGKFYQRYGIQYKNSWGFWRPLKSNWGDDNPNPEKNRYYLDIDPVTFRTFDEAKEFLDENITCKADLIAYNKKVKLERAKRERLREKFIEDAKNAEAIEKAGRTKYFVTDLK